MTSDALALARDGDPAATPAAVALWRSIVGHGEAGDVGYVRRRVDPEPTGGALDQVSAHVGSTTDVPDHTLRESVFRCGSYLQQSAAILGFSGAVGEGLPDGDPRTGGYSALRRSGAMSLLEPWKIHRAGVI